MFGKACVESYDSIFWRISGMRGSREYEIVNKGDTAEISEYEMRCASGGGMERILARQVTCPNSRLLELLNSVEMMKWDGFNGKHPRGVRDGEMFSFRASVNGGTNIRAEGSENFPKGFRDFRRAVGTMLSENS